MISPLSYLSESRHWFWSLIGDAKSLLWKAIVATLMINFMQIFTSLFVMAVYNKVIPNSATNSLVALAVGVAFLGVFDFILKLLKARLVDTASDRLEAKLQPALFSKVLSWDLHKRPQFSGNSATLVRDLESIVELFANNTITTIVSLPFVLVNLSVIWFVAGPLALISTLICIFTALVSVYYFFRVSSIAEDSKKLAVDKSSVFLEVVSGLEALKGIASYEYFEKKWEDVDSKSRQVSSRVKLGLSDVSSVNALIQAVGQVSLVSAGAYLVILGDISTGGLIAAVMLNGRAQQPLGQLAGVLQRLSTAKASYKRLDTVFQTISTEEMRRQNIRLGRVEGPIILSDLTYRPDQLNFDVFSATRLLIKPTERVGVVGSVGSGKSTFLKLLSGVLTPTSGTVSYGSFDTSAIHQADLRRSIAYLGQTPGVFAGTIRDNIVLGADSASEERLLKVVELTGLDSVLSKVPNGLSFVLSEGGRELSGGQRQILALARAMYSEPTTLLFDEPTSAMDPKHERLFINRMSDFVKGKALVVVTHRKPILALTERVLVIESGKIILDGKRDEVLSKFK